MSTPLRIISNVPGITFDPLKTDVIFAEDMNNIKAHIDDLETGEAADGDVKFGGNTLGAKKVIGSIDNQDIGFLTNNTERITVLKSGYVGIGTTSPSALLHLQAPGVSGITKLIVQAGQGQSTNVLQDWQNNAGTSLASLSSSGVFNSTAGFTVGTHAYLTQSSFQMKSANLVTWSSTTAYNGTADIGLARNAAGVLEVNNGTAGSLAGLAVGTLTTTGNVGIGTTSPTAKLHLAAGTASANTAPLKFTAGVLNTVAVIGAVEFVDNGTDGHLYITLNIGGVLTRKEIAFV